MTSEAMLATLQLPAAAVLNRRVAKADFESQLGRPADRRLVAERVEALVWHAALNTALPPGGLSGLAVVTLSIRGSRSSARLLALVHPAVPDPLLLIASHPDTRPSISVKPALGEVLTADLPDDLPPLAVARLALNRAASLGDLHARWCDAVLALYALSVTGRLPGLATDLATAAARRERLDRIVALDARITKLTLAAKGQKQAGKRAELNLALQAARRQRREAAEQL